MLTDSAKMLTVRENFLSFKKGGSWAEAKMPRPIKTVIRILFFIKFFSILNGKVRDSDSHEGSKTLLNTAETAVFIFEGEKSRAERTAKTPIKTDKGLVIIDKSMSIPLHRQ